MLAPLAVNDSGLIVQFPDGKPFKTMLPVAVKQFGWVIVPIAGAEGVSGCAFIIRLADKQMSILRHL